MKPKAKQTIAFLVAIFLLLLGTDSQAQTNAKATSGDPATSMTSTKDHRYQAALKALRNFEHDAGNRFASQIHYNLLKERMELEKELLNTGLSKTRIIEINNRIASIEDQISLQQFSMENAVEQITVSDKSYVNYNNGTMEFITQDEFLKLTPDQQQVIALNPSGYRIVTHSDLLPQNSFRKIDTSSEKFKPSNTRLQNLSTAELEARGKVEERYQNNTAEPSTYEYDVKKSELETLKSEFQAAESAGNLSQEERQTYLDKIAGFESEVAKLKQLNAPEKPQFKH